jgi:hypothetical protein
MKGTKKNNSPRPSLENVREDDLLRILSRKFSLKHRDPFWKPGSSHANGI